MKVTVSKVLAGGEQVVVELSEGEVFDLNAPSLQNAFRIMDSRLWEMNQRVLQVNAYYQKLVKKYPKAALMVNDILQELTGQKVFEDKSIQEAGAFVAAHPTTDEREDVA